jgi:hypothetical protein
MVVYCLEVLKQLIVHVCVLLEAAKINAWLSAVLKEPIMHVCVLFGVAKTIDSACLCTVGSC